MSCLVCPFVVRYCPVVFGYCMFCTEHVYFINKCMSDKKAKLRKVRPSSRTALSSGYNVALFYPSLRFLNLFLRAGRSILSTKHRGHDLSNHTCMQIKQVRAHKSFVWKGTLIKDLLFPYCFYFCITIASSLVLLLLQLLLLLLFGQVLGQG